MSKPTGKLIRLTANDVGAYTKAESDTKIADAKKAGTDAQTTANTANTNATNANNNANGRVPNTRKVNNKALSADITITAGDVGSYTKAESDTKIADAKKAGTDAQATANTANTNATNANNNANGRVPNTRKVNNKALSADITITAGDVGSYTKAESDTKIADAKKAGTDAQATANTANTNATNANNNANGRVPNTRKINNKALSADITITAGDVGAYTRAEVDSKIAGAVGIGYGQAWVNVTTDRKYGVIYKNTLTKPIMVFIFSNAASTLTIEVRKDSGSPWIVVGSDSSKSGVPNSFIVPQNHEYRANSFFSFWSELR